MEKREGSFKWMLIHVNLCKKRLDLKKQQQQKKTKQFLAMYRLLFEKLQQTLAYMKLTSENIDLA